MVTQALIINPEKAAENLADLLKNSYPGRIILIGLSKDGKHLYQFYAIMGRSESSRNRRFIVEDGTGVLRTEIVDPSKETGDTSLTIYTAMAEIEKNGQFGYAVSNGAQTEDLLKYNMRDKRFTSKWKYEPDSNSTPRISALCRMKQASEIKVDLSIFAKADDSELSDNRYFDNVSLQSGFAICFHTYKGDGKPLPPFKETPYYIPLPEGSPDQMILNFWNTLN